MESSNEDNKHYQEQHQHKENLHNEPSIRRDTVEVFQELILCTVHIAQRLINIFIYSDGKLPLLLNLQAVTELGTTVNEMHCMLLLLYTYHVSQLLENPSNIPYCRLNLMQSLISAGQIGILRG